MVRPLTLAPILLSSFLLAACGGGSDSAPASTTSTPAQSATTQTQEANAPAATGNTAVDGFNWFNFRRQQIGLPTVAASTIISKAAQNHSDYQKANNTITHDETAGKPGFTGASLLDRLAAVSFPFVKDNSYAFGEVISATSSTSGASAAEELITAIYHRYAIFEPVFKEAGFGSATISGGYTYFTTDFAANNGFGPGLGSGKFAVYPYANQQNVPTSFNSDSELPDPVPSRNTVGYPISVHADITSTVKVTSFTVQARGGNALPVQQMTHTLDPETPNSAAAIIPLSPLTAGTTYDVHFVGSVDNVAADKSWSFVTR